jgi:type 1 glutamine amidotransferase
MARLGVLARQLILVLSTCALACSTGASPNGSPGAAGSSGSSGAAGVGAAGASGAAGSSGASGAAGTTGVAGTSGAAGSTGAAGTTGGSGATGAAGTGVAGTGGAGSTGAAGTGAAGTGADAGTPDAGGDVASRGNKVLLYTKSTGFVHDSTVTAAAAIAKAAAAAGLVTETSADPAKFQPAALAQYAGVVLIATAGEPLGSPGTAEVQTLVAWVRAGGGFVAIENANHAYDNNADFIGLIGGDFNGHSGLGPDYCYKEGDNPSVVKLPATFPVTDEIYYFTKFRMDNQVVLRCASDRRPISWVRQEGAGRIFYTALGHSKEIWNMPPLVDGHVLPGLLWTMGRPVP